MNCVKDLSQHLYAVALIASIVLLICKSLWIKASATCEYNFSSRISVKSDDAGFSWHSLCVVDCTDSARLAAEGVLGGDVWSDERSVLMLTACRWPLKALGARVSSASVCLSCTGSEVSERDSLAESAAAGRVSSSALCASPHSSTCCGETEESYYRRRGGQLRDIIITRLIGRFDYDPLHSEIRYFCINYANFIFSQWFHAMSCITLHSYCSHIK